MINGMGTYEVYRRLSEEKDLKEIKKRLDQTIQAFSTNRMLVGDEE